MSDYIMLNGKRYVVCDPTYNRCHDAGNGQCESKSDNSLNRYYKCHRYPLNKLHEFSYGDQITSTAIVTNETEV